MLGTVEQNSAMTGYHNVSGFGDVDVDVTKKQSL